MFPAPKHGEWEPNKIRKKPKNVAPPSQVEQPTASEDNAEDSEYEEDPISDEGAVWPIRGGTITNWPCFYALMHHVHNSLNAPFHTPILVVGQPCWTAKDHENITQFFFEKFKTPGFAVIDSAQAACYAFGLSTATVVDIGADKADITTIVDHLVDEVGRTRALPKCGGEAMTTKLQSLLASKGFNRDMCEQLKKSPICEILPADMPIPGTTNATKSDSATSSGTNGPGLDQRYASSGLNSMSRGSGHDAAVGDDAEDDEGVIDVASIVARGNTTEFLARKEAEKAEKLAAKKKGSEAANAAASKPVKTRNFEREKNTFFYEDHAVLDAIKGSDMSSSQMTEAAATLDEGPKKPNGAEHTSENAASLSDQTASKPLTFPNGPANQSAPRRELTVGPERFQAASGDILIDLSTAIHRTVLSNPHANRRADLWDSLIIIGNGARVRGFKEALLQILLARFLISPSSATMFTSELPSNFSTPHATGGTNTPQSGQISVPQGGSGVNPLLYAATTASAAQQQPGHPPHTPQHPSHNGYSAQAAQGMQPLQPQTHSGHGQTPTSIRTARLPDYFPEWKDAGSEEAMFLGAQVAAKVVFVNDIAAGTSKGFMSRSDYNESGPSGIHEFSLS